LSEFRQTYALYSGVIEYLEDNVILLKKYIVNVLTSSVRHLGNTVSSRAEGRHRVVKEYFTSSVGDLLSVVNNLCISSTNQFFDNVRKKISSFALDLALSQISKPRPFKQCFRRFYLVFGIPCCHMIDEKLSNGVKLEVNDFIVQWWLENNLEVENRSLEGEFDRIREFAKAGPNSMNSIFYSLKNVGTNRHVLNPQVSACRGRPRGSLNRSTRRDRNPDSNM
jgi:hypothetical protein